MKRFLSTWFGCFRCIRRHVGGVWIYCTVYNSEWIKLEDDLVKDFDRFNLAREIKHEDYRGRK